MLNMSEVKEVASSRTKARVSPLLCLLVLSWASSASAFAPTMTPPRHFFARGTAWLRTSDRGSRACQKSVAARTARRKFLPSSATALPMAAKSGAREVLDAESFRELVLSGPDENAPSSSSSATRPVLVFFSAPWCGPCRLTNPVVRDVMRQFDGRIDVLEACTDDLPEVATDAGVVSIPTIQIYFGGELMDTIVGCVAKNVLASAVDRVLEDLGRGIVDGEELQRDGGEGEGDGAGGLAA